MEHLQLLLYSIAPLTLGPNDLPHSARLLKMQHTWAAAAGSIEAALQLREECLQLNQGGELCALFQHCLERGVLLE